MHPRGLSTALFLAIIVLMAGVFAGCGGGDQSGSASQEGGAAKETQDKVAPAKKAKNVEKKILFGNVAFVNTKTQGFSVRPSTEQQGDKPVVFKLANKSEITLGGNEAKLEEMKKGQQAQVEYVVRNDRNQARSVRLFEGDGGSSEDGDNPPEEGGDTTNDQGGEKAN